MNENQNTLRSALSKNFANEGDFSLDFNMQDSSNQESSSNNQNKQENASTSSILESLSDNSVDQNLEADSNYM